uniref:Uncharacterized protein n=1 Tax=Tanacetum cinerariifolium TaxID=118510 RepID=A0A6L2NIS0_TANCI|nr:hypothetical protein [Tanacetum cinerariifolium]
MTVDNVTFQTNNVTGNFNYPPNVPAYKPIMIFFKLPFEQSFHQQSLSALSELLQYLPDILSNSNFTKHQSIVFNIELTVHMIAVNNQKDSVSPLPFSAKKKKVKSQTSLMKARIKPRRVLKGHLEQRPRGNKTLADMEPINLPVADPSCIGAKYQAHALKQKEELAAWDKSSTNMAWNLGFRLLCLKRPPSSVTPTLALTHIPANIKGENEPNTATEDPLSHTKGETDANRQEKPEEPKHSTDANIEFIGSSTSQPSITQAQPITIINPVPIIDAYLEKEEKIKKAKEEARLLAMKKPDYRGTNGRNFDVHNPFAFGNFSISDLDEMREIIPKKKNVVVKDLINSLSQRKRKHMELEPEIKIPGLECNRTHLENVPFINNMVIEEPEWSDIDKVGMEALISYLISASMVQSPENVRFSMKLKKLIAKNPDQENLKSKKVKLEALGYEMD